MDISVVIPSRNEELALPKLLSQLVHRFEAYTYEIIVVDDSDDETPSIVTQLMRQYDTIKLVHRLKHERDGLAQAVLRGISQATGTYIIVMDGDGQHPPDTAVHLVSMAIEKDHDMIMATRYISGASAKGLASGARTLYSRAFRILPTLFFPCKLRKVTDPLGGFFLVRRDILKNLSLQPIGWKISLEVLLFAPILSYGEIPFVFNIRIAGESKADSSVARDLLLHLWSLMKRYYFKSKLQEAPCATTDLSRHPGTGLTEHHPGYTQHTILPDQAA